SNASSRTLRKLESVCTPRSLPSALPYECGSVICRISMFEILAKHPAHDGELGHGRAGFAQYMVKPRICERVPLESATQVPVYACAPYSNWSLLAESASGRMSASS